MVDPSQKSASNPFLTDDIPEATREKPASSPKAGKSDPPSAVFLGIGAIVLAVLGGAGTAVLLSGTPTQFSAESTAYVKSGLQQAIDNTGISVSPDTLLGHKAYEEAPLDSLVAITADGSVTLRRPAANAFVEMANAARNDGVYISPLSGFRSIEQQQYLFFGIKEEQAQRASERATVSAPPGYSEHHTGYAIDVGDADQPMTHLEQSFENTAAFQWLKKNAARYSYELSFEKGETNGVSYEPWQWRYVGDRHSLETFYGNQTP